MTRQILIPIIALAVVSLFSLELQQQAEASRDGFEDGKDSGRDDWNAGRAFNDDCYDDFLYCLGYKAGYRVGYEMANSLNR